MARMYTVIKANIPATRWAEVQASKDSNANCMRWEVWESIIANRSRDSTGMAMRSFFSRVLVLFPWRVVGASSFDEWDELFGADEVVMLRLVWRSRWEERIFVREDDLSSLPLLREYDMLAVWNARETLPSCIRPTILAPMQDV